MNCWEVLELEPTGDRRAIKRAYSRTLKRHRPEDDAEAFQQVRAAFEEALELAAYHTDEVSDDWPEPAQSPGHSEPPESPRTAPHAQDRPPAPRPGDESREVVIRELDDEFEDAREPDPEAPDERQGDAHIEDTADALLAELMRVSDSQAEAAAIAAFDELALRCQHETLDFAREIEGRLFFRLAGSDDSPYPGAFFAHVVEHYGWDNSIDLVQRHPYQLGQLLERIHSNATYRALEEQAAAKPSRDVSAERIAALKSLLGHTAESKRKWLILRSGPLREMRAIMSTLDDECPVIFENELDTEAARWWRASVAEHHFTIRHFWCGLIIGVFCASAVLGALTPWLESLTTNPDARIAAGLLSSTITVAAVVGALFGIDRLRFLGWRRVKPALLDRIARVRADRVLMRRTYWGVHALALGCYWLPSGFSHLAVAIGILGLILVMESTTFVLLFLALGMLVAEVATGMTYLDGFEYTGSHVLIWLLVSTWALSIWSRTMNLLPGPLARFADSHGVVSLLGICAICAAIFWALLGVFEHCLFGLVDCAGVA